MACAKHMYIKNSMADIPLEIAVAKNSAYKRGDS